MTSKKHSFRDAVVYDSLYHVYKRGNSAHIAGMIDGFTYTGYTLCGRKVQTPLGRRFNEQVCAICERRAQALDDESRQLAENQDHDI